MDSATPFPGWRAAAPVGGAVLLIIAGPTAWPNRVLLSLRYVVWLGLISYPLYLWHWPLLVFAHIEHAATAERIPVRFGIIFLSVALAWLTYIAVEQPIRSLRATVRLMGILCGAITAVAVLGLLVFYHDGVPSRLPEIIRPLGATIYKVEDVMRDWRYKTCFIYPERDGGSFGEGCVVRRAAPLIYLWGDSHAAALYPGLDAAAVKSGFGLGQFTTSGCPPLVNWISPHRSLCRDINDWNVANIEKLQPDVVIVHASWLVDYYPIERLDETLTAIASKGQSRLIVVGPAPHWNEPVTTVLFRDWSKGPWTAEPPRRAPLRNAKRTLQIEARLRHIAKAHNAEYFSIIDTLCNEAGCLVRLGDRAGDIIAYDGAHLSPTASAYVVNRMPLD